ncbi:ABC transporter permease [Bacillus sp. NPDC077027]|uniref:ABC transporter permease n=1 Tax=Bacillus sp. NPDC077027 TaxID=3390548 RepID=UPI003D028727
MFELMRLELRKSDIRKYIRASIMASVLFIGFIYFVAYVAQVEQEADFQQYANIYLLTSTICMIFFSILTAVMYCRFVITEYTGRQLILLLSYPINRKKILLSKILLVVCFSTVAMIASMIPPFVVFSLTESVLPIVQDTLTVDLLLSLIKTFLIFTCCMNCIGLIAMRIGFIKKSIPTTILTAIILCAVFGNVLMALFGNDLLNLVFLGGMIVIVVVVALDLMKEVNRLEVK